MISILTPFKNTAQYLGECIESIQNQSINDWELIMIDDHSTDESRVVVEKYADADTRISVYTNTGEGIIDALRKAFIKSKGNYITRMDSDDVAPVHKLETLRNSLIQAGRGFIATGLVQYFPTDQITKGYKKYEGWLNSLTTTGANFQEIYKECPIASPNWMVHRGDLMSCGAFDTNLYPEDYDLMFRLYRGGLTPIACDKVTHLWRDYADRTSKTSSNYAEEAFLHLKAHYFLEIDYDSSRPLAIWGAGEKGKFIASFLLEQGVPFHWITANPNKVGQSIYRKSLDTLNEFENLSTPQSVITVADERVQNQIHSYFTKRDMVPLKDYFFFC